MNRDRFLLNPEGLFGAVGRPDHDAGELPCAFIVLREGISDSAPANYNLPREVHAGTKTV